MADEAEKREEQGINVAGTPSIPSGDGTVWADVSLLLQAASKEFADGELIHGENFSLFAAMSALEIMDPKMDSGMDNGRYHSIDEAIESGAAPVPISFDRTLDALCVIDVMDHLLTCEATWHLGHSLAQTVFSCIYLLRIDRTSPHALLYSYCRVVQATCNVIISVVSDARTHEEEDLFTMAYGLPLGGEKDDRCLSTLNAVEETLSRQLRACKAPSAKKMAVEDVEPLQTNFDLEEGFCKSMLCRLRFRKHFYHLLMCMKRPQGRGFELARKHIASCLSELERMRRSSEFIRSVAGTICEDNIVVNTTASGRQPIGFDANLNFRSSAPAPPRTIKTLSWKMALEYFEKLLHDMDIICSFTLDPLLENVLRFVVQFQKSQPDLVARAHLQLLLIQDGKLYGRDPIFSVICRVAALPEAMKDHDIQKNEFVVQLGQFVINLMKILCTNVAWQRRKLGKILQDWRVIYVQLELAFRKEFGEFWSMSYNENPYMKMPKHILIWVEEQAYWIASRFLLLGFDLDLYSPTEYCMVYWYIYVVLIKLAEKTHLRVLAKTDTAKRKGKKKRDSIMDMAKDYQFPPAVLLLQCYICLAEGLTMMLAALRNERKAFINPGPFNTEHERFLQHFEHLQKAGLPDHITYLSFEECTAQASLSTLVTHNHFKDAQRIAKELKHGFPDDPDRTSELRRIEQVAEHNSIALSVISRVAAVDPSLKISFEFTYHPYFAVAVVKRS
ncbi:hypothetical protein Ancab_035152 [Ancistrocladus abbreviatus]